MPRKLTTSEFIERAHTVHGDKYDYSLVEYVNNRTKVEVTCLKHGEFKQTPSDHLGGYGCPKCGGTGKLTTEEFIERARSVHGDKYDYSLVKYVSANVKVDITCNEHGVFPQTPMSHMEGHGCRGCRSQSLSVKLRGNTEEFIERARSVHGDKYDYSLVEYRLSQEKVTLTCEKHGRFEQRPTDHVNLGHGCPKCANCGPSKPEQFLNDWINFLGFETIQSDRSIIAPLELDIVIPEKKIAIEYNGLMWHSEAYGKDRHYHKTKTDMCRHAGYRLIHIWEDDYHRDTEMQLRFINRLLGVEDSTKVFARKCKLAEIESKLARSFLDEHHIQGSVNASRYVGLHHGGELVAVTSFRKNQHGWELTRHATSVSVIGALGKVTKWFARNVCDTFHTFCDISRFDGRSYEKAGFTRADEIAPDYMYLVDGERRHKFGFRLKALERDFPEFYATGKSEREIMEEAGIPRVWDCGKIRYQHTGE